MSASDDALNAIYKVGYSLPGIAQVNRDLTSSSGCWYCHAATRSAFTSNCWQKPQLRSLGP